MIASPEGRVVVAARHVSVSFGATRALRDVSIVGHAGSVHAVTGENGAGKSTLMKVLAGVHRPDAGIIEIDGREVRPASPREALRLGISTVFQELTLFPNLTVAENLFAGREPVRAGIVLRRRMFSDARELLRRIGIELDPGRLAGDLSIGEQQVVEIAKGVSANASVFIFDEPTAALNKVEVEKLGHLMQMLKAQGKAIFYISHRMEEISRWCDTVTVLKDGAHVLTRPMQGMTAEMIVTAMVGRSIHDMFPARSDAIGSTLLQVRELSTTRSSEPLSLNVRRGEIVGIAGLEGQGQREFMRSLAGVEVPVRADVSRIDDADDAVRLDLHRGRIEGVRHGVAFVPEDRKTEGLFLDLPISQNLDLGMLATRGLMERATVDLKSLESLGERLKLVAAGLFQPVGSLSGGNQQKVLLGRWLTAGSDILLIEEPTRGVDVGAKAEIYRLLRDFTSRGGCVLLTSSELLELIGLCDRIVVMRQGRFVGTFDGGDATEESIMSVALPGESGTDSSRAIQ